MKNLTIIMASLVSSFVIWIGTASAVSIPFNINALSEYEDVGGSSELNFINIDSTRYKEVKDISNLLNQNFDLTFLGAEAGWTDKIISVSPLGSFNNQTSTIGDTINNVDLNDTSYTINGSFKSWFEDSHIKVYQLETEWDLANNSWDKTYSEFSELSTLGIGTYIIGFGDSYGDGDYDDMIISAQASVVPLPAAVWLFGTALIGLVGIRRRAVSEKLISV